MARRALRICSQMGCGEYTRDTHCDRHRRERGRGTSRNRPGDPFYSSAAWRRLRAAKLARDPLCEASLEKGIVCPATEVDHILDRCDRPDLELSIDNLQSLSKSEHSRKTAKTMAKRRRHKRRTGSSDGDQGA